MTDQHPITPPPELQEQWWKQEWPSVRPSLTSFHEWMLAKSAQWGYDQRGEVNEAKLQKARDEELEACCEWTTANFGELPGQNLHLFRRPEPPSLKKQALEAAYRFYANNGHDNYNEKEIKDDFDIICRALEALPDD